MNYVPCGEELDMGDESDKSLAHSKLILLNVKSLLKDKLFLKIKSFLTENLSLAANFLRRKKSIVLFLVAVCLVILAGVSFTRFAHTRITSGVTISGISVGNLTQAQAKDKIMSVVNSALEQPLFLKTRTETIEIPLKDLGLSFNAEQALDTAFKLGRSVNVWERSSARLHALLTGCDLPLNPIWADEILTTRLEESLRPYDLTSKDAFFKITADHLMQIIPDETGSQADIPVLAEQLRKLDPFDPGAFTVPYRRIPPAVTAAQLEEQKITGMLANFTTTFDPNLRGRSENIRLAALALDGTIIKPGEEFSFNETVGPRTAAAGYREAMIIENSRFVPGLGGGVCQVSSTLYNVVLLADLEVSERHPHALPVSYVAPGKDATIAWASLDFKFKNNSGGYLLLKSAAGPDSITINLYGKMAK